ncbi:MAG TPA: hypothetical protein VMT03_03535 [Polyangia bacterium]|nr:hypothetical protein [Polyangia bacterium]
MRVSAALLLASALPLLLARPLFAAPAPPVPLAVAVRSDSSDVSAEVVRRAIESELQTWVVSVDPAAPVPAYAPRLAVEISVARADLTMRYDGPGRRPLVRVIPLPAGGDAVIRHIAWLAGDLVRDQASDLLAPPVATAPPPLAPAPAPAPPPPASTSPTADASLTVQAQPVHVHRTYQPVTVSLLFPIASNPEDPDVRTHLSANLLYGRVGTLDHGLQLGLGNHVSGDASGMQAGIVNGVGGNVDGAQVGTVNHAGGQVTGLQVGLVNSAGDVRGVQAGLVNVGRNVQGVQLGLVNVSDDIEGVPIGLINVSASGGIHPVVWTSGTEQFVLGLKFSTRRVYTLFSGATSWIQDVRLTGPGLAIGVRFPAGRVALETDVGGAYMLGRFIGGKTADLRLFSWRVLASLEAYRHLSFFAGAALTARLGFYEPDAVNVAYQLGPELLAGVQL